MYKLMTIALLAATMLGGCSVATDGEEDGLAGDHAATDDGTSAEQALVPTNCGPLTPQESSTLVIGSSETKRPPYGIPSCPNAYLFWLQHFNSPAGTTVAYAGTVPTTKADCERIEVSQITYTSSATPIGQRTSNRGFWTGSRCSTPITGSPRLPSGQQRHWVQALDARGRAAAVRVTLFAVP
jgi:hypothetical protein